jgi:hypothetical protein
MRTLKRTLKRIIIGFLLTLVVLIGGFVGLLEYSYENTPVIVQRADEPRARTWEQQQADREAKWEQKRIDDALFNRQSSSTTFCNTAGCVTNSFVPGQGYTSCTTTKIEGITQTVCGPSPLR